MEELKLWEDIFDLVSEWVLDHPKLYLDELVDDLYEYIIDNYGPPF